MFHVGHLNILQRARLSCDFLIAGVVDDGVAFEMKGRHPVVPEDERLQIVASMDVVDEVYLERTTDKLETYRAVGFDVLFKGDDWRGTRKGERLEAMFRPVGVTIVYFPYTPHISTTNLRGRVSAADADSRVSRSSAGVEPPHPT